MKLEELEELRTKIVKGQISHEEAKERLFTGKKSWHEAEWNERREKFLNPHCEQCGKEKNLRVQHFWHPSQYGEHKYLITIKYGDILENEVPVEILVPKELVIQAIKKHDTTKKLVCPECGSGYRERKTMKPKCICLKCKWEFENPLEVIYPTFIDDLKVPVSSIKPYEYRYSSIRNRIYSEKRKEKVKEKYGYEIEKETLLACIKDSIRYQSFKDAKTWCKKCAFNYDVNNADLCPSCKKNYKRTYYPTCLECKTKEDGKPNKQKNCGTCQYAMPNPKKDVLVCAAGTKDGPYDYGDEITDDTLSCENWKLAFHLWATR